MLKNLKNHFINKLTEDLIQSFNDEISKEILDMVNKHLYNYELIKIKMH